MEVVSNCRQKYMEKIQLLPKFIPSWSQTHKEEGFNPIKV